MKLAALDLKLVRDAWRAWGQVISIALVVACGVMTVVTMRSNYESLRVSLESFYERGRFADVFVSLVRAPEPVSARVGAVTGVAAVETRVAFAVSLNVPGLVEPATGRLVSVPAGGSEVNRVHLVAGRAPERGRSGEVIASNAFATANDLVPGDTLGAVINGRWETLRIVGIGMSPEFVYEVAPGQLFPDSRRFGVLWMEREALAAATAMEGAFNELNLILERGASESAVIGEIDRILDPYGSLGAYGRDEQVSNRIMVDELESIRVSGTVMPAIFLGVAAFLLHIVLSRMVRTQREQIAILKAFGYTDFEIGQHFLRFALVAVALGVLVGAPLGAWLGRLLVGVYESYFQFPELIFRVSWPLLIIAVLVSASAAAMGAVSAVRAALRLPPAEAMRPEAPARFRPGILERVGLGRLFTPAGRMVLRNLERQPARTSLSAIAIALSVAILLIGSFMFDSVRFMADLQYRTVQREDLTILFTSPRAGSVARDLAAVDGVSRVETFRSVPARLRSGHRSRQVAVTGLGRVDELRSIVDAEGRRHRVPEAGLLVSQALADLIGVGAGDTIRMEVLEGRQPAREVVVAGVVDELFGLGAYMRIEELNGLMREGPTASGAFLLVDDDRRSEVYGQLERMPAITGVASRDNMLENFEVQLEQSLLISMSMLIFFAGVIAVGVIYNGARIALSERGRELASLRVLGFTRQEIAVILFGEQAVVTLIGIPLGFLVGYLLASALVTAFATEAYRIPLVVAPSTYAFSALVAVAAAIFAGLLVRRRLNRLDLIAVLKTRE